MALKYAIMVDGVTKLIMMKSDVLDSFETIKACVAYKMDGEEIDYFPFDINETIEPVYVELPGWDHPIRSGHVIDLNPHTVQLLEQKMVNRNNTRHSHSISDR